MEIEKLGVEVIRPKTVEEATWKKFCYQPKLSPFQRFMFKLTGVSSLLASGLFKKYQVWAKAHPAKSWKEFDETVKKVYG